MLTLKLALRNLIGAGTRTWLNVLVTSLSFVLIIFMSGMYRGLIEYAMRIMIATEIGGGEYWHPLYDPEDPLSIDDAHGPLPPGIAAQVAQGRAMPVLVIQGSMYPNGRMMPTLIKGIPPGQQVVDLPTGDLAPPRADRVVPVFIGTGMAQSTRLQLGDRFSLRWMDAEGTYDAVEAEVVTIVDMENFKVDRGQVWIPLARLQQMAAMADEATYAVVSRETDLLLDTGSWLARSVKHLLQDIVQMVQADQAYAKSMYGMLIGLAALGIFNSQVLSIFRRQKEIGTLMALGMTRSRLVGLFTLEGGLHSLLALILAAVYGGPLLYLAASRGIPLPYEGADIGFVMAKRLFPVYSVGLLVGTTALVAGIVTLVSYLPARKIAQLKPTEALRGRVI